MTRDQITALVVQYWPVAIGVAISVLNGLLGSYKDKPKATKWIHTALDMLSVLQRKDSPGTLKAPLKRSKNA